MPRSTANTVESIVVLGASLVARSLTLGRTGNLSALDPDGTAPCS